jgi:anti-sigma factor RsiW
MDESRLYESYEEGFSLCTRVRESLPELLEGLLDAMTAEAIRAHLKACYLCKREYDEMQATIRLLEALPFVDPAKDFAPVIMASITRQKLNPFQKLLTLWKSKWR